MGLFGRNEETEAENAALREWVAQWSALPLADLAEQVMLAAFGPGGPGSEGPTSVYEIGRAIDPSDSVFAGDDEARQDLAILIAEGMQVLEHACLIRWTFSGGDHASMVWRATRLGKAAVAEGSVGRWLGSQA